MQPTEKALALEREIRRFLGEVEHIHASQQDFDPSRQAREVVVTAPEYLEQLLLPAIAMVLRRDAPRVTLSVRSPDQRRIDALLAAGDVDFRLGWVRDPQPSVRAMPLFEDDVVVIGGPGNGALAVPLTLAAYMALPHVRLLGSGRTTSGRVIDEFVKQHGERLAVCIHAQGLMALLGTLMVSDAVATVPRRMALKIQEAFPVQMVDFPGQLPRVSNALYWHERTQRSAFHKWFRGVIGQAARGAVAAYPSAGERRKDGS